MAVTPNYGWPVPVATDYVKDGWEAISDLGNAIDTTVAGLGTGLTLITSQTFTTQSAVAIDNVFSSSYLNYFCTLQLKASTGADIQFYFRSGTPATDYTANEYTSHVINRVASLTSGAFTSTLGAAGLVTTTMGGTECWIGSPFASERATLQFQSSQGGGGIQLGGVSLANTVSFNGIKFFASSGTITGTIKMYGYKN